MSRGSGRGNVTIDNELTVSNQEGVELGYDCWSDEVRAVHHVLLEVVMTNLSENLY